MHDTISNDIENASKHQLIKFRASLAFGWVRLELINKTKKKQLKFLELSHNFNKHAQCSCRFRLSKFLKFSVAHQKLMCNNFRWNLLKCSIWII